MNKAIECIAKTANKSLQFLGLTLCSAAIATGTIPLKVGSVSNIKSASASLRRHEHEFAWVGRHAMSQEDGDRHCRHEHTQLPAYREYTYGVPFLSRTILVKKAWDGADITSPTHVWYHRSRGTCIANQTWAGTVRTW